ncbi:MAG TPA: hypothetical protein VFI45_09930 [Candidatus Acidoferrum sp.]|nr:hypothetical protein [Candidatus Acidoferrum sp.]
MILRIGSKRQIEKGLSVEDPAQEMDLVNRLENHMLQTLEHLKAFHLTVSTLMIELAAVRKTTIVTEKAQSQYKLNLAKAMRQARPLLEEAARSFDDQINSVNNQTYNDGLGLPQADRPKFH